MPVEYGSGNLSFLIQTSITHLLYNMIEKKNLFKIKGKDLFLILVFQKSMLVRRRYKTRGPNSDLTVA